MSNKKNNGKYKKSNGNNYADSKKNKKQINNTKVDCVAKEKENIDTNSEEEQLIDNNLDKTNTNKQTIETESDNSQDITISAKIRNWTKENKGQVFVLVGVLFMILGIVFGIVTKQNWIMIAGLVIGGVIIQSFMIYHFVYFIKIIRGKNVDDNNDTKSKNKSNIKNSKIDNSDINESKKTTNKQTKVYTKQDKKKVKIFIISMLGCLVAIIIGGAFAGSSPIGFAIMAVGVVGFIGSILYLILRTSNTIKKYEKYLKLDKSLLTDFYDIREGVVVECSLYGQLKNKNYYALLVMPLIGADLRGKNDAPKNMLCEFNLKKGTKIMYYQNKSDTKDCYFIKMN